MSSPAPVDRTSRVNPGGLGFAPRVTLLSGGIDRPYVLGLALGLAARGCALEIVGGVHVDCEQFRATPGIKFKDLIGGAPQRGSALAKVVRLSRYYCRLLSGLAASRAGIVHVLWNYKLESFDRTLLMLYCRALGKRVFVTAHNINKRARDGSDTWWNRLTLRCQYRLASGIFVHSRGMARELASEFGVRPSRIQVIPLGVNPCLPRTAVARAGARQRLGLPADSHVALFWGRICPYKGLEYLIQAAVIVCKAQPKFMLLIAGAPQPGTEDYWQAVLGMIRSHGLESRTVVFDRFIPDEDAPAFFSAADVMVLPYTAVYQSGVLSSGFALGLPAIVTDVGSLAEEIREGRNGYVCRARDPGSLAATIGGYFSGPIFASLPERRAAIAQEFQESHAWDGIAGKTIDFYLRKGINRQ